MTIFHSWLPNSTKTLIIARITLGSLNASPAKVIIFLIPLKIASNVSTKSPFIDFLVSSSSNILPITAMAPAIRPPVNNDLKKPPILSKKLPPDEPEVLDT